LGKTSRARGVVSEERTGKKGHLVGRGGVGIIVETGKRRQSEGMHLQGST